MNIFEKIVELKSKNQSFVMATVVRMEGSVPGKVGFKLVVEGEGKSFGTIGGGEIEQRVYTESLNKLQTGESGLKEYILQKQPARKIKNEDAEIVPMMCNGKVWIFYDVVRNNTSVFLFGGGHVGQALCYFLNKLNYHITLIDNREEFLSKEKNPFCQERILASYSQYAEEFKPPVDAFVVIMTQGHSFDYDVLKKLYDRALNLRYVGIIASKNKAKSLIKQLKEDFGSSVNISNLYTPIGLDIGGFTESDIALSIASQLQAIRFGKEYKDLRENSL